MQWYNIKEKSAGKLRLKFCLFLYKFFGKKILRILIFFVALFTYIKNKDIRYYSKKYFYILFDYTKNKKLKPSNINSFKHVLSYSYSLVDKFEVFLQKFDYKNIVFSSSKEDFLNNIKEKGVFVICNHVGNIDILRSLFSTDKYPIYSDVSIFLQKNHCKIFNDFLKSLEINIDQIKVYPVEEIDLTTANTLDESLKKGGIAFMAGDRVPSNNDKNNIETEFLNNKIRLPNGVFRFAKMLNTNIYFVSCIKYKNKYRVYLKKQNSNITKISEIQKDYIKFLEEMTIIAPYQFYHFCDFFIE